MGNRNCKTGSSQKQTVEIINWAEIDEIVKERNYKPLPDGAITSAMIAEKFNVSGTTARAHIMKLVESGKYEKHFVSRGCGRMQYVLKV